MGALDGYIGYNYVAELPNTNRYIKGQPAFEFTKTFIKEDFSKLVEIAECNKESTVWIPNATKGLGKIGIDTWYARCLLEQDII